VLEDGRDMPPQLLYTWLNPILLIASVSLVCLAFPLVVFSFVSHRFSKRRLRLTALTSFIVGITLGAANYGLIFLVQLPAYSRQILQRIEEDRLASSLVKPGDRAPNFRIKVDDGSDFEIDHLRGKVVVLNFFATWCGPCIMELPHLQETWDTYRGRTDFALLAVDREETSETVTAFKKKQGYTFPIAADPKRSAYSQYAKERIPRTYRISRDGMVRFVCTGFNEERFDELKRELAKELHASN
jgi:peroxiredoxin